MAAKGTRIEVGLVLQGGGALGAYEWGAIEALFGAMDELEASGWPTSLKVVTGVSIGAINGACVAGAKGSGKGKRDDGIRRLGKLWAQLKLTTPFRRSLEFRLPGLPSFVPARDASLLGLPGFYVPRMDFWDFWRWTSFYNTSLLEQTLRACVCFDEINSAGTPTTFIVTAVDVQSGILRRFRNKPKQMRAEANRPEEKDKPVTFEPKHILASGSLAPQFPWTEVGGALYWDGGIVDKPPLGDAIEALSSDKDVYRLVVVMNLYPLTGKKPANLLEVADRVHELSFGNKARQDSAAAQSINDLLKTVDGLADEIEKAGITLSPTLADCLRDARGYKVAKTIEIDLQRSAEEQEPEDDESGLRDFSPETVDKRRRCGYQRARTALIAELAKDHFAIEHVPAECAAPTES